MRMIDPDGWDARYRTDPDPFSVDSSWYERRKLEVTLASLARERYGRAWDCAAGTGHLAAALADRCDQVLATDASGEAVRIAARRTAKLAGVRTGLARLPDRPDGADRVDLTVVSEVLYYLAEDERQRCLAMLARQRGELVCVHWRHLPHDAHLSGAEATAELGTALTVAGWTPLVEHQDPDFVLGSWHSGASR